MVVAVTAGAMLSLSSPARCDELSVPQGQLLYNENCGICHAAGILDPGYLRLKRRGVATADLSARTDLSAEFVNVVVRQGLGSMPAFTPTHVTDAELAAIARYLSHKE